MSATLKLESILPQASLIVFEEAAHWPQFERHEQFNSIVVDYLNLD